MDFSQPLCRERVVSLEEGGQVWVSFKYEQLPNICYWCGWLDHDDKDCPLWIKSKGSFRRQDKQFGSFMRATQKPFQKKKKKWWYMYPVFLKIERVTILLLGMYRRLTQSIQQRLRHHL